MSEETDIVKERLNLVEVVGEYVTLKQAGQNFKGLCPFHHEKTPSFMVSPARGTWHCFGCNSGGDVISFVQQIEGIDFPAALAMLAERAGVTLKPRAAGVAAGNRRKRLFDVMGEAAAFYHHILLKHKGGQQARQYLAERGVRPETMELFTIGYAPMQWDSLQQWLLKKGFTLDEMVAAGVAARNQRGTLYDRFRGRIIFPIHDTQGRVVAFGGRVVPWHETGNEGKYVNSPETELYAKRRVVYNLNRAKGELRGGAPCVVVEGYMDVVMTVQAGVPNVVASSGTAFTPEHIEQLARFTKTLHFAFDADRAGWKATVAATNAALAAGMTVQTVKLPEGKDPADIALETPEKVPDYFTQTYSLTTVLLDQFRHSSELATREAQLDALLPLLKSVNNPIVQGKMIQEVAEVLHVPEAQVHKLLLAVTPQPQVMMVSPVVPMAAEQKFLPEWHLLGLMLGFPAARELVWDTLSAELFVDVRAQMLYNLMKQASLTQADFLTMSFPDILAVLPAGQLPFAEGVTARTQELVEHGEIDASKEATGLLAALRKRQLTSRLKLLQETLLSASEGARQDVLQEFRSVTEELAAIS